MWITDAVIAFLQITKKKKQKQTNWNIYPNRNPY